MVKLVKLIPKTRREDEMSYAINETMHSSQNRGYNGLSGIGTKCHRAMQLDHYNATTQEFSARMLRLFGVGHRMEPALISALAEYLGIKVTREQEECIGFAGHFKGHIDGVGEFLKDSKFAAQCLGVFLLEFKTHKASSFNDVKKNGVLKAKPMHYDQMTSYSGYFELDMTLYVAYNKDTSEIYLEWVPFDAARFRELKMKEAEIVTADALLPRIGNDSPMWHDCKLCHRAAVCFGKEEVSKSCKNCQHVDVLDEGGWQCSKGKGTENYAPCDEYELMGMLHVD